MKHGTTYAYSQHRCRCEPCRQAVKTYRRALKDRKGQPLNNGHYWPLQALFEAAGTTEFVELSVRTGIPARTLHRSTDRGLTDSTADRAAIGLGLHPITIWPQWFDPYLKGAA